MRKKGVKGLIEGVGIVDLDYQMQKSELLGYTPEGKEIRRQVWVCPYYRRWRNMLKRCYSAKDHLDNPTYIGCSVCPDWLYLSNFKAWMEQQDWEGNHLDKDLLRPNNKVYGPDTCLFVSTKVNGFLVESTKSRGLYPIGVSLKPGRTKFNAKAKDLNGNIVHLGYHHTVEEAQTAWVAFKLKTAIELASLQTDRRIAEALIKRYENYEEIKHGIC